MVRLTLTFRENVAMLRASRDEALTDALTGLGNRRALGARRSTRALDEPTTRARSCSRCSTSTASSTTTTPSATRPATRCSSASAPTCAAYLARPRPRVPDGRRRVLRAVRAGRRRSPTPIVAGAARRCPSTARASTIGCSVRRDRAARRGRATPPRRCGIADQRMYAQKHAGRMSAARQSKDVLLRALAERNPDLGGHLTSVAELAEAHRAPARAGRRGGRARPPRRRAARRRQGRDPRRDPRQARPARPRTSGTFIRRHTLIGERIVARGARARAASPSSCAPPTSAGTAPATRTASPATEIPLGARIVAVGDAFDAMTSDAPLPRRRARPAEALDELRALRRHASSTPVVVEAFASAPRARRSAALRGPTRSPEARLAAARVRPPDGRRTEQLKRTPLHDRHVAAGARLVPFAGWEMPVQYAGIREEHVAVRDARRRVRRLPHGRDRDDRARRGGVPAAHALQRRHARSPTAARSTRVLCQRGRRRAGRPLHLPARRRPLPDGHQRVQPREGPRVVPQARRGLRRRRSHDRLHDYAMLAVQGPEARGIVADLADGELPKRFRTATLTVAGAPDVLVCGTGYTGEDGVELLVRAAATPTTVWDALIEAGAAPAGLGARDTLRLEVCFHLYGNDLMEDARPDRGRPRLVLQGGHRLHRRRRRSRGRARPARREARPVRHHRPGHRPPGQPGRRRRRGDLRHAVARA